MTETRAPRSSSPLNAVSGDLVHDSPFRLTAITIAGGLLATAGFLADNLLPAHTPLPLVLCVFSLLVLGMIGLYWGAFTLRQDVQNERWSDETLAPFRRITGHPLWTATLLLLCAAMFASLIRDRHHNSFFWAFFVLIQTQSQLAGAFARPRKPTRTGPLVDWSKVAPLHSDHWGQR